MRSSLALLLMLLALGCTRAKPAATSLPAEAPPPVGKLPSDVTPRAYTVELEIVPSRERFSGRVQIAVELTTPASTIWLHGKGLTVSKAQAKSAGSEGPGEVVAARYREVDESGLARLDFDRELATGKQVLELSYEAAFGKQLDGLYKVTTEGKHYAFTQFEAVSARQALPCFDEPRFKTPFDLWITLQADHQAITNTRELASEISASGMRRVHFAPTKPLPTYLLAFLVGPFDVVEGTAIPPSDARPSPLPLRAVGVRGRGPRLGFALAETGKFLVELERYFGIAYPYEKLDLIAVPDFGAGAMENAAAITFREWLLLLDAERAPESQRRSFANVMAHELAHHWFGNLVTMPWWDDIWLNEGFATFLASKTVATLHPEQRAEIDQLEDVLGAMDADSKVSARKVRQPIESTHDIANAFDGITYQKGAGVLAMFERYLGAEAFRRGLSAYLRAHAYGVADASDLFASLSKEAVKDVSPIMGSFLDQSGVPLVQAGVECPAGGAAAELVLAQSRYLPTGSTGDRNQRWQIPLCARYEVRGKPYESCTLLTEPEGRMPLLGGACPSWLLPNADGAGYYRWSLATADLEKLRKGFPKLTAREKLSLADSLGAGFASGSAAAGDVLAALPMLASDPERSVSSVPLGLLRFVREHVLAAELHPLVDKFAKKLYEPRLRALGWKEKRGESGDTKLARAELLSFFAHVLRDPQVRAPAAKLGRRYLGLDAGRPPEPDVVPVDLRGVVSTVAVQDDPTVFDALYQRFTAEQDPAERDRLLSALSSVTDERSPKALALALDPALRANEVLIPLRSQLRDERTREAAWAYVESNFDALTARLSKRRMSGVIGLAGAFCSKAMADRVLAFFGPRSEGLLGGPRSLASTHEALTLCAAQVEQQRESTRAFFEARR